MVEGVFLLVIMVSAAAAASVDVPSGAAGEIVFANFMSSPLLTRLPASLPELSYDAISALDVVVEESALKGTTSTSVKYAMMARNIQR